MLPVHTLARLVNRVSERHRAETKAKLSRRARARYVSVAVSTALAEYAKQHAGQPEGELEQSYRNSIYCGERIEQADGVLTSKYCGNRWCLSCNRIRMGKAINAYEPVVSGWEGVHFVTLTVENPTAGELEDCIGRMTKCFGQVVRKLRRDGHAVEALRKTECTYSAPRPRTRRSFAVDGSGVCSVVRAEEPGREDYHPHFHVVVRGRRLAYALLEAWVAFAPRHTGRRVERAGQDVRPMDPERGLKELFKYFSKLTAKTERGGTAYVGVKELDVMFRAMRGRRVYQTYGFRVARDANEVDELDTATVAISREGEAAVWLWDRGVSDWVDRETGECLTGHTPDRAASRMAGYYEGRASERGPP